MQTIKEAPNYRITKEGAVESIKSGKEVTAVKGAVRLTVEGKRKSFKIEDLKNQYFPSSEEVEKSIKKMKDKVVEKIADRTMAEKLQDANSRVGKVISIDKSKKAAVKKAAVKKEVSKKVYPFKIKKLEAIENAKKDFSIEDKVSFIDYKTKKRVKGTLVSHTVFGDKYPGARVSFSENNKKKSKVVSYLNLKKQ